MSVITLNLEPADFSPAALDIVTSLGEYRTLREGLSPANEAFWHEVGQADVIWTRLAYKLDADFFNRAPKLRVIVTATTGLNHIDEVAATARDISIVCLKGEQQFLSSITSTAELTLGLMLEAMRHVGRARLAVTKEGLWDRDQFRGRQLSGQKIGIVGMGRLGKIVCEYAFALRMNVLFCDSDPTVTAPNLARRVELETLLKESSIVSLHANYTASNRGLIGRREFGLMQPYAWLINTSRGELVDEDALLLALEQGAIGGAAIDVLENENSAALLGASHPLITYAANHENLIITPHIGGACIDAMAATEVFVARKLARMLGESAGLPCGD